MKKLLFQLFILIFLILSGCQYLSNNLGDKIIKEIDKKRDQSGSCKILMKDITVFKWDKMVIYEVGSSNNEITKALGVEYQDSVDLISGVVFVYNNKIVYKEKVPYNPERSTKMNYYVENEPGQPNCMAFTPDNAIFEGSREQVDEKFYYAIKPLLK